MGGLEANGAIFQAACCKYLVWHSIMLIVTLHQSDSTTQTQIITSSCSDHDTYDTHDTDEYADSATVCRVYSGLTL